MFKMFSCIEIFYTFCLYYFYSTATGGSARNEAWLIPAIIMDSLLTIGVLLTFVNMLSARC